MLCDFVSLVVLQIVSASLSVIAMECESKASMVYGSEKRDVLKSIQTGHLRVAYMDVQYVTQNQAAIARTQDLGMDYSFGETCDDPDAAIPEWSYSSSRYSELSRLIN